jgi:hypothetical protein
MRFPVKYLMLLIICLLQGATSQDTTRSTLYIPTNLDDALDRLMLLLPDSTKSTLRADPDSTLISQHFGIGLWMRNNWGLWSGSRLAKSLDSLGLHHPDDMSGFILETFWYRLHDKPVPFGKTLHEHLLRTLIWHTGLAFRDSLCPIDRTEITSTGFLDRSDSSSLRVIYFGRCASNHLWCYEPNKPPWTPRDSLLQDIAAFETTQSNRRTQYRLSHPIIRTLENLLDKVCHSESKWPKKDDLDSLAALFASYTESTTWIPDSIMQCSFGKIADAAKADPFMLSILFRIAASQDHETFFGTFLTSCSAAAVFANPPVLIKLWRQLSSEERSNVLTTLAPWDNVGLIGKFRQFAKETANRQMRTVANEIANGLQAEAE